MYVPDDPDILQALQMQEEYARSTQILFGRYTPQQIAQYGLSFQGSIPGNQTPWSTIIPPTTPPSTQLFVQTTRNPTPSASNFPSAIHLSHETLKIQVEQQASTLDRVHHRVRRTTNRGSGGGSSFCCFGGGVSQAASSLDLTPCEDEDHDPPTPNESGMYYALKHDGEPKLGSKRGKLLKRSIQILEDSTYHDCIKAWKDQDPNFATYIEKNLHL